MMNRYSFLGAEADENNVEWCFIFDSETGFTLKSQVKAVGGRGGNTNIPVRIPVVHADNGTGDRGTVDLRSTATRPAVDATISAEKRAPVDDPTGRPETPEERAVRIGQRKVPPAFLGNTSRMHMDPSKSENGATDVTPHH